MAIEVIFTHTPTDSDKEGELGVDSQTNSLYWNGRKIVTEQKITLPTLVNVSVVLTGIATMALAVIELLRAIGVLLH